MPATVLRSNPLRKIVPPIVLLLAACASVDGDRASLRAYALRHAAELEAFEAQKAFVKQNTPLPQRLEFPGVGSLLLREFELMGWPGRVFLHTQFTFENTSGRALKSPRVTIHLLDPETGDYSGSSLDLVSPLGLKLAPGSTFTSWLDVDAGGLRFSDGWQSRVNVEVAP